MTTMDGRVAIVTGGSSGIGAAVAQLLATRGVTVALVGRGVEKLAAAVGKIEADGGRAFSIPADLTETNAPEKVVSEVVDRVSQIDFLVNNAGGTSVTPLEDVTTDEFEMQMKLNVQAPLFLVQQSLPALQRSDAAAVVNITSAAAGIYRPGHSVYGSTKAALEYLTRSLATELAPDGIRVNAVAPGPVDTPLHAAAADDVPAAHEYLRRMMPLGRIGSPDEVAWWVVQLLEPTAAFVTGAVIPVDGGRRLGPPHEQ